MNKGKKHKNSNFENNVRNYIISSLILIFSIFNLLAIFGLSGNLGAIYYNLIGIKLLGLSAYFFITIILFLLAFKIFDNSYKFDIRIIKIINFIFLIIILVGFFGLIKVGASQYSKYIYGGFLKFFDLIFTLIIFLFLIFISLVVIFSPKDLKKYLKEKFLILLNLISKLKRNKKPEEKEGVIKEEKEIYKKEKVKIAFFKKPKKDNKEEEKIKEEKPFNILWKKNKNNSLPPINLLSKKNVKPGDEKTKEKADLIKSNLKNFKIDVEVEDISVGPTITRFSLRPASGVRVSKISTLQNDLSLALAAYPLRIEAPIPGKSLIGIEIPNQFKQTIALRELIEDKNYQTNSNSLLMALGKNIEGQSYYYNLSSAPHLLIAGTTGSGKSVMIHNIICSLLYRNNSDDLKFIFSDPKKVELTLYENIPHLLTPVITNAKNTILGLKWSINEMERRYEIFTQELVRDLTSYEQKRQKNESLEKLPKIVIIIDELADIMQVYPKELEASIIKLSQKSRATGIHLILSTQRPSVNVITGLIKANIPSRIALQVSSHVDSRTIIDSGGAEKLLGSGDLLFISGQNPKAVRIQSAFISETEIKSITEFLVKQSNINNKDNEKILLTEKSVDENIIAESTYSNNRINFTDLDNKDEEDEIFNEAVEFIIQNGRASTSFLQRKFKIGYSRAARLIDIMEDRNIVGPANGSKPREILIKNQNNE